MSEAQPKDARAILNASGPQALRDAVKDPQPFEAEPEPEAPPEPEPQAGPDKQAAPPPPQGKPEPFKWDVTHGAETWTKDVAEISKMSDAPIVEGLLREREVASVIGAAKTSKTWFTLALALAVSKGEPFLERETFQRKTLYLDYELKPGTFRKRMSLLSDSQPNGFFYQCLRGLARLPRVDEIAALVETEGFGLVVIDSLYRTGWLSEENNNDTTSRELTALQTFTNRVGCSVLVVDHTAKGGGVERSAVDAARGASSKGGFYDCLLVLRPTDKGPDPAGKYAILDAVVRDWPEAAELPLVSFSWHGTGATVELAGTVGQGEADANATKILEVLAAAEKPIGKATIQAATGIPETTLRNAIARLVARGLVEAMPDPKHKQRLDYRSRDAMDEPRQTPSNPAA